MVTVMVMVEENQLLAVLGINMNISQQEYSILNNVAGSLEVAKVADILLLYIKRNNQPAYEKFEPITVAARSKA
jgi:hypothetical protein